MITNLKTCCKAIDQESSNLIKKIYHLANPEPNYAIQDWYNENIRTKEKNEELILELIQKRRDLLLISKPLIAPKKDFVYLHLDVILISYSNVYTQSGALNYNFIKEEANVTFFLMFKDGFELLIKYGSEKNPKIPEWKWNDLSTDHHMFCENSIDGVNVDGFFKFPLFIFKDSGTFSDTDFINLQSETSETIINFTLKCIPKFDDTFLNQYAKHLDDYSKLYGDQSGELTENFNLDIPDEYIKKLIMEYKEIPE